MDEIVKGVIETDSLPENVEQLVKVNIKDGKASATLFANPNGSKIKQRLDSLEARFNNLKTINYEELYGPGNISIKQGGESGGVTKSYVDTQDNSTYEKSKSYTDSKINDLRSYVDNVSNTTLEQAKSYADSLSYGGGSGGGDKSTVVLIDAVGRASAARSEAYTAYKAGKAIVLKCAADKFIPMTVVSESSNTVDLKGFDLSYSGYTVTPNVTLVTRMWTLDSTGLNYVEKAVPINSCRTFDCTKTSVIANTFADAMDSYKNGFSIILKVDANTFVVANVVTTTSLTGYSFSFNTGTTSEGQTGIVSVDIVRWRLTSSGLTKDTFSTSSSGSGGGGGGITLRQAFSTKTTSLAIPNNPDDDPAFWNQSSQTSASIWAAQKSTGNDWVIWKLQPQNGTDGRGITSTKKYYGKSKSSTVKPTEWSETMPDASQGEYIWTKVVFTYSDGTSDEYYTVSYVGKNGIDGKDGTAVNIIGTLTSKDELPESGNTNGDGYLIDGDLWVYNGNTITSDVTYRGFTNVGRITGPSPCFHVAWCNGDPKNGDYTGFDVDAPVGSQFDFMGTYVDYPKNVETCPDSTNPADYTWTRIRGVDGVSPIRIDLDNENVEIALTYEGYSERFQYAETKIAMFEGVTPLKITSVDVDTNLTLDSNVYLDEMDEYGYDARVLISIPENSGALGSGLNNVKLTVRATCLDGTTIHVATANFKINGVKAGSPGEDAVTYSVIPSEKSVVISNGKYKVSYIKVAGARMQGDDYCSPLSNYTGSLDYKFTYSKDGNQEVDVEENYNIDITDVSDYITFRLYINGVERDSEKVWMLKVNDGEDGQPAKIIDTNYEYAVSMSFTSTPADLSPWVTKQIEVEPGQYLYIKTIRTWNSGDITYDYSWVRGGLNGYSNLPYVSTVFKRSATTLTTPTGGDYNNPLPDEDGWSDGVPEGTDKLWFSQRKFTIDGLEPQESEWSTPASALSTSRLKLMYSSEDECPKAPNVAPTSVWSSVPDLNSKWMAMQKIIDGMDYPWVLLNIKGEGSRIDTTSAATPFMGEWDASTKYYGTKLRTDIVRVSGTSGADDPATYYYIANKAKNFDGVITPQPGTTDGAAYWLRFGANYDNLATGFLFSEKIETDILNAVNAHIDQLDVDSLDVKIVNAINNGEGVINADKINVDDLTAKKLKTADSGAKIVAEENTLYATDEDGSTIFNIFPDYKITDDIDDKSLIKNATVYTRSYSGTSAASQTTSNTFGSLEIPASGYPVILGADNLRIGIRASNSTTNSKVANRTVVSLYYTIDGKDYLFAKVTYNSSVSDGSMYVFSKDSFLQLEQYNIRQYFTTRKTVSIKSVVEHSAESNGQSSLSTITSVSVSILTGSTFTAKHDRGVFITTGAFSAGCHNSNDHAVFGTAFDGEGVLDVAFRGNKFIVSDNIYAKNNGIGLMPLLNPVVIDVSTRESDSSGRKKYTERELYTIVTCFNKGIPVYIKMNVYLSEESQWVNIMAMVNAIQDKAYTSTTTTYHILATADIHNMFPAKWSDSTDYRVNVFLQGVLSESISYDTSSTDYYVNGMNVYIHTV